METKETRISAEKPTDIFVNFRDMLLYVLLRWRVILAVTLVLTVLAGGFSYWKDYKRYQNAQNALTQEEQETTLDTASQANALRASRYQYAYDSQCAYNKNALKMQINPDAVPTRELGYAVTGQRAQAVAHILREMLSDPEMYRNIPEVTDDTVTSASYAAELVYVSGESSDYSTENPDMSTYSLIKIEVIAPTVKQRDALTAHVLEKLGKMQDSLRKALGVLSFKPVYDNASVRRDMGLLDSQLANFNAQKSYEKSLKDSLENLTGPERDYMNRLLAKGEETQGEEDNRRPIAPPSVSKKWLVLGFVGGILLCAAWYIIRYLSDGRVKSAAEMTVRYPYGVFGMLQSPRKKKQCAVDRWLIRKLRGPAMEMALLQQQVALAAAHAGYTRLYLTGCSLSGGDEDMLAGLVSFLKERGIALEIGESPVFDAAAADRMSEAQAVIFTEKIGASRHGDIRRQADLVSLLELPVLGCIVLQ